MTASPGPDVAAAVRAELARRGRTQTQAAAQLGFSGQAMSRRTRGLTPFSADELISLAKWLDIPVDRLLTTDLVIPNNLPHAVSA